ncbi:efflux transporter outer membrane subunit, partial [Neisseria sp. P0015.S004]
QLAPADALHALEMAQQQLQLEKSAWTQKNEKIRNSLAVLTGRVPGALNGQVPEKMAAVPSLPVSRIETDLLAARPDIAAQKALLEEKWHIVKSTEAEFYPNIELKVLAGMTHIDAFNLIRGRTSGMLGIVPALNLPLFTSGALQ